MCTLKGIKASLPIARIENKAIIQCQLPLHQHLPEIKRTGSNELIAANHWYTNTEQ
jgi:hypothetical protein